MLQVSVLYIAVLYTYFIIRSMPFFMNNTYAAAILFVYVYTVLTSVLITKTQTFYR